MSIRIHTKQQALDVFLETLHARLDGYETSIDRDQGKLDESWCQNGGNISEHTTEKRDYDSLAAAMCEDIKDMAGGRKRLIFGRLKKWCDSSAAEKHGISARVGLVDGKFRFDILYRHEA